MTLASVIKLDPWAGRLAPGRYAMHGELGMCRVLDARGLWRTVEALMFAEGDNEPPPTDVLQGERVRSVEISVPVFSLREPDPVRDLQARSGQVLIEFSAVKAGAR